MAYQRPYDEDALPRYVPSRPVMRNTSPLTQSPTTDLLSLSP